MERLAIPKVRKDFKNDKSCALEKKIRLRPAGLDRSPHLKHGDVVFPVDLIGRRVEPAALLHVLVEDAATLHVAQAELAQVQLWKSRMTEMQHHGETVGGAF